MIFDEEMYYKQVNEQQWKTSDLIMQHWNKMMKNALMNTNEQYMILTIVIYSIWFK